MKKIQGTTIKPETILKFDYTNNYQSAENSEAINAFHFVRCCFDDLTQMNEFVERITECLLCDWGLLRSFCEYDDVDDDPAFGRAATLIPEKRLSEIKQIYKLIDVLKEFGKDRETISCFSDLRDFLLGLKYPNLAIRTMKNVLSSGLFHVIQNGIEFPVIPVPYNITENILNRAVVRSKGEVSFVKEVMKKYERKKIVDENMYYNEIRYNHPMVAIQDEENTILIEESRKTLLQGEINRFSINHLGLISNKRFEGRMVTLFESTSPAGISNFVGKLAV